MIYKKISKSEDQDTKHSNILQNIGILFSIEIKLKIKVYYNLIDEIHKIF
jgi:hypothetical protein